MSGVEGKVTRVGARERGQQTSFKCRRPPRARRSLGEGGKPLSPGSSKSLRILLWLRDLSALVDRDLPFPIALHKSIAPPILAREVLAFIGALSVAAVHAHS